MALHTLNNTGQLRQLIEANTALTQTVSELALEIHDHICGPATTPANPATP